MATEGNSRVISTSDNIQKVRAIMEHTKDMEALEVNRDMAATGHNKHMEAMEVNKVMAAMGPNKDMAARTATVASNGGYGDDRGCHGGEHGRH